MAEKIGNDDRQTPRQNQGKHQIQRDYLCDHDRQESRRQADFSRERSDAWSSYRTFIRRITSVPPKPPIGFCPMGSIRDIEMDDENPEWFDVMNSVIDDPDIAQLLDSVKVEHYRFRTMCCRGRECDEEYPCTWTWYLDGDGSGFHARSIEGHYSGTKVRMIGLDGQAATPGCYPGRR